MPSGRRYSGDVFGDGKRIDQRVRRPGNDVTLAYPSFLHGQDMTIDRVVDVPPAVACLFGNRGKAAVEIPHNRRTHRARITGSVYDARLDDHCGQPGPHYGLSDFVVCHPLRAIVLRQPGPIVSVRLVDDPSAGIGEHAERTGIDNLWNAQLPGQRQDVARPIHVDAHRSARIADEGDYLVTFGGQPAGQPFADEACRAGYEVAQKASVTARDTTTRVR